MQYWNVSLCLLHFYHLLLGAHWDKQCFLIPLFTRVQPFFLFYQIRTERKGLRICFPDLDTLADWIPLRTFPKGAIVDFKYCQRTLTETDFGFVCTSWKHILGGKDLAIVFYFYTMPGYFIFSVLLDIFNLKRGSVCSPSSFCQEDRFGKTHASILFFLLCIQCVCGSAFFVSICVGSSVCVCVCMPVCRYMSPWPCVRLHFLHPVLCPAQRKSRFEQSSVSCPVS